MWELSKNKIPEDKIYFIVWDNLWEQPYKTYLRNGKIRCDEGFLKFDTERFSHWCLIPVEIKT
jgi:hypothetical protein